MGGCVDHKANVDVVAQRKIPVPRANTDFLSNPLTATLLAKLSQFHTAT